jgi:transposase
MPRPRRSFSAEFKAQVVLQLLSGEVSQAELCRKHSVNANLIANWKAAVLDRLHTIFEGDLANDAECVRIAELEQLVGGPAARRSGAVCRGRGLIRVCGSVIIVAGSLLLAAALVDVRDRARRGRPPDLPAIVLAGGPVFFTQWTAGALALLVARRDPHCRLTVCPRPPGRSECDIRQPTEGAT